jgi:hypothetical protein
MNLLAAVFLGALAGAHIATWGMYKDAPHEGYSFRKYSRAIKIGCVIGFLGGLLPTTVLRPDNAVVFFGCVYAAERGVEELYKTFLREEDQAKYFIPMQFHLFGRIVQSRAARWSAAGVWIAAVTIIAWALSRANTAMPSGFHAGSMALIGGIGGWLSAFGGALKDAPIEGFQSLKFLRSPAIATIYAVLLAHMTSNVLVIPLAAIGYTVATIETYKTFFFPSKPRGKFAGKPILFPEMLVRRQRFVPPYVAIWILIVAGFIVALAGPHRGGL